MRFGTVINCIDGRVQVPVIQFLEKRFGVEYIDSITEPGPILVLSEQKPAETVQATIAKVQLSIERHDSKAVAIVAHHDCAANPVPHDRQMVQLQRAVHYLRGKLADMKVIGLWVDENRDVHEIRI